MVSGPPNRLVETLEGRLGGLSIEFNRAFWKSQVEATPENEARRTGTEMNLRRAKGDNEAFAAVTNALDLELHEPLLHRQLESLRLWMTGDQMGETEREQIVELSSAVESDFAQYRPIVDGDRLSDNQIEDILRTSNDSDHRRQVWEASKEIGGIVSERVRELARVRNKVAHDLGYADYYRMSLDLQELSEEWLFGTMDELENLTEDAFVRWKKELDEGLMRRFSADALQPWHYADPFFQMLPPDGVVMLDHLFEEIRAPSLAERTFKEWGIDLSGVMTASDLFPREKKSQHAFCLDVDRTGRDVRILANVVPGERWVEIMLHESGHAAYDAAIDQRLPFLLRRAAHTFVTEAIAILSGRLVRDPDWLVGIAEIPKEEVEQVAPELARATRAQSLLFARWGLVMVNFERDLYSDPEADLDARWWELVERFQRLAPPPGRAAPDWAAKIHLSAAPVYYHNYLLGEMLASQLHATCLRECGGLVGAASAGQLLIDRIFKQGALMRWDALIEEATGGPLSGRDFAAYLSEGV